MALHRDERVLAIDKPAGVSMATGRSRSEADTISGLLRAAGEDESEPLHLVHRLDLGTSGVVLLARDREAHRELSRAFQEREVEKTYRAICWGHPVPAHGLLDAPLGRDPKDGRRMAVRAEGKPSRTRYRTLRRFKGIADLELTPETGRTHQIRVHLASRGHPIVGDDLYGAATRWHGVRDPALRAALAALTRPLLHAARIVVPALGLDVSAPLPRDFAGVLAAFSAQSARNA